jgi:hypothetical protein
MTKALGMFTIAEPVRAGPCTDAESLTIFVVSA